MGRCGGEAQVVEDLPNDRWAPVCRGGAAQAGSITAITFIVPPQRGQSSESTS
jgi:hypothetical protein